MRLLLIGLLLSTTLIAQERVHSVAPAQAPPHANRVCSPGVDAGDYVYISGQGPLRPDGSSPATFNEQVRQVLDNVKAIVESSGLTMDHVVYTQVYLSDISQFEELNKVFAESFPKTPPARAVLGVARIPAPPIQINAVAVRDLKNRRAVYPPNEKKENSFSPGILTHDRLFVSSMAGADPTTGKIPADPAEQVDLALDRVEAVLKAAGLELSNMVFVNPYLTSDLPSKVMNEHYAKRFEFGNTPARATIEVSSLPGGAHIEYTGVAVRDLSQRKSGPAQEYAAKSYSQSLCLCRRHLILLGKKRIHSRTARRRVRLHHASTNFGRRCGINWTTSKRPAWSSARSYRRPCIWMTWTTQLRLMKSTANILAPRCRPAPRSSRLLRLIVRPTKTITTLTSSRFP